MVATQQHEITNKIKEITININDYQYDFLGLYKFITHSIAQGKERIEKLGSVDLIIIEDLSLNYERVESSNLILQKKEQTIINVYVFGNFKEETEITWELSEILGDFYVEYLLLPIIHNINYQEFDERIDELMELIKNGVIVYEAKRSLHYHSL
jgi:hypothetical protein